MFGVLVLKVCVWLFVLKIVLGNGKKKRKGFRAHTIRFYALSGRVRIFVKVGKLNIS